MRNGLNMWNTIITLMISLFGAGLLYISFRAARFQPVLKIVRGKKWLARLLCLVFFAALTGAMWAIWNMMNAIACMIHLILIWLLFDLASFIIGKIRKRKWKHYWAGLSAIIFCILWLTWGWVGAHYVRTTTYTFHTLKLEQDMRIVQFSDSHVGATFHAEGLLRHIEKINAMNPDVVVVTGDFVDNDTSREDMLASCDALGQVTAPKGVLFVYGNHDKARYGPSNGGWTGEELRSRLEANGVIILEDAAFSINEQLCIAGRKDRSDSQRRGGRISAEQLLSSVDHDQYIIVLDHQPNDFDAEAAAGADLVLCGHTHAGQFIPIDHVGEWIGENDLRYGHEKRQDTDFIVTSGISNWAFKFKTSACSEYVVIDLVAHGTKNE